MKEKRKREREKERKYKKLKNYTISDVLQTFGRMAFDKKSFGQMALNHS